MMNTSMTLTSKTKTTVPYHYMPFFLWLYKKIMPMAFKVSLCDGKILLTDFNLTMFREGSIVLVPRYSTYEANPSFSHVSSHHFIVTRFPNH